MGTYTTIVAQKYVDGKWVIVLPEGIGYDPDIPHSYGKLDMMDDIDKASGYNLKSDQRIYSVRQDFQSPGEYAEVGEFAPWARRGLPIDVDTEVKEIFEDEYQSSISWVGIDELLSYDFDKETVVRYQGKLETWTELLKPAYRRWFELLKEIGVERVIYANG